MNERVESTGLYNELPKGNAVSENLQGNIGVDSDQRKGILGGERNGFPPAPLIRYGLMGRALAELVGTFFVVLVGVGANALVGSQSVPVLNGLVFGFAVVAAMVAFGKISGGHFNPAISLGSALAGRLSWKDFPVYLIAQLVGAIVAGLMLFLMFLSNPQVQDIGKFFESVSNGYGTASPSGFGIGTILVLEVVLTALLCSLYFGSTRWGKWRGVSAPLAVGLGLVALMALAFPMDIAGLNPVRSTATAIFGGSQPLSQLWVFWVGPLVGGAIAGLLYRSFDISEKIARLKAQADEDVADAAHAPLTDEIENAKAAQVLESTPEGEVLTEEVTETATEKVTEKVSEKETDASLADAAAEHKKAAQEEVKSFFDRKK